MEFTAQISYAPRDGFARLPVATRPLSAVRDAALGISRGAVMSEADAAFMAGAALNSLDNLVRAQLGWAGAWRQRQALKCAVAGMRLMGRGEDEAALRDAVLLCAPGDDSGPAGKVFLAFKRLSARMISIDTKALQDIASLFALKWDDR